MKLPERVTLTQFLHVKPHWNTGEPNYTLFNTDISGSGSGYACLGEVTFELDVPNIDPVAAMIEALERDVTKEREDSARKVNLLLDQISKLQCLEYRPGGEA